MSNGQSTLQSAMVAANAELAAHGHTVSVWESCTGYAGVVGKCPNCRVTTMVDPDGTAYGPALLVDCATLRELYEASIIRGTRAQGGHAARQPGRGEK